MSKIARLAPLLPALAAILTIVAPARGLGADIALTSTAAVKPVVDRLAPSFERVSGNRLVIEYGTANLLKDKLAAGAPFDVAILTGETADTLIKGGKIMPASRVEIARAGLGIGVRKGAAKPDLSSTEAFKRAMLGVASVCFSAAGVSGVYATRVMKRLGIAAAMKDKTIRTAGAIQPEDLLVNGECQLSIQQMSGIVPVPGVELAGPMPPELQRTTIFTAGISTAARQPAAAASFLKFLTSPAAIEVIKASGLTPG